MGHRKRIVPKIKNCPAAYKATAQPILFLQFKATIYFFLFGNL
jgi:hypothetical protein